MLTSVTRLFWFTSHRDFKGRFTSGNKWRIRRGVEGTVILPNGTIRQGRKWVGYNEQFIVR